MRQAISTSGAPAVDIYQESDGPEAFLFWPDSVAADAEGGLISRLMIVKV